MKNLAVLGSTGSIGTQVLHTVRRYPDRFKISLLTANKNAGLLAEQAREFKPKCVVIADNETFRSSKPLFDVPVFDGFEDIGGLFKSTETDTVVAAVVGMSGFEGVAAAVNGGLDIALANKESLVAGGKVITALAKKTGSKIMPVDSEHSAVFQCLDGLSPYMTGNLKRIILTASGGSFYGKTRKELEKVTVKEATKNPNWSMGKKITVDSSTMMNKALEIIEARWLFDTFNIDYIIHKESVIHSMVEFNDGVILSQMSYPSMEYPIQFALSYPERLPTSMPEYAFNKPLTFLPPDEDTFPFPKFAKEALKTHEGAPLVLNAANEAAVSLFLNNAIGFADIFNIVENVLNGAEFPVIDTKESVITAHNEFYKKTLADYKSYIRYAGF